MEVPYQREVNLQEEEVEEDLQITRRKRRSQSQNSNSSSSESNSVITSDSSDSSSNFEYFLSMENTYNINIVNNNTTTFTNNGEKPKIIEGRSIIEEEDENFKSEDHINVVHQNQDSNGYNVPQNGVGVVEYSPKESNAGDNEIDVGSNVLNLSKSPESDVGLKNVGSLFDESSSGVNVTPPEAYNDEQNMVNNNHVMSGQYEIVEKGVEFEPEAEEYDVERVIQNQETHDLICPNCNACITKRVILKRRKRKIREISEDEEASGPEPYPIDLPSEDLVKDKTKPGKELSSGGKAADARLDGVSCFSCFSIFVPKGDGFLCWRFKPKVAVAAQPGDIPAGSELAGNSLDDGTGTSFPLWFLTCCQPYHPEKPVPKPESEPSPISEHGKKVPHGKTELPLPPSHELPPSGKLGEETPLPHTPESPVTLNEDKDFPLWILTCCQPSADRIKPEHAPRPGTISEPEPLNPEEPVDGSTQELPVTTEQGKFPLWILTCCQPANEGKEQKHSEKPGTLSEDTPVPPTQPPYEVPVPSKTRPVAPKGDDTVLPPEFKGQPISEDGPEAPYRTREPPSPPADVSPLLGKTHDDAGSPLPPKHHDDAGSPLPPKTHDDAESPLLPKPKVDAESPLPKPFQPNDIYEGKPSPSEPEPPGTPPNGDIIVPISEEPPIVQPPAPPTGETVVGNLPSFKQPLLPREPPRPGVSGLDIIKAIVYGGLLECITSLSVISSAAGGDATTLNIVALGLANVFGGFVLLLHNLRVLKHEHSVERYEDQLGTPGHFLLHAVVAVISYLVFGLMSPIIYGFTFRKSDNKNYKLATLAAASLVCITILSIGKAYVRRPPKTYITTILYYITIGVMVSGVGYVAGDLINMLLIKMGVFDASAPVAMPVLEAGAVKTAWSSY